jgi:hypothetical protein
MNTAQDILTNAEYARIENEPGFFVTLSGAKQQDYYARSLRKIREYPLSEETIRAREFEEEVKSERRHGRKCECGGGGGDDFPWVSAAIAAYGIFGDW